MSHLSSMVISVKIKRMCRLRHFKLEITLKFIKTIPNNLTFHCFFKTFCCCCQNHLHFRESSLAHPFIISIMFGDKQWNPLSGMGNFNLKAVQYTSYRDKYIIYSYIIHCLFNIYLTFIRNM